MVTKNPIPESVRREQTDTRDLHDLLAWLEYGRTTGHRAARCTEAQELHWANLLRNLLAQKEERTR
jgi:hypothetical protein